MRILAIVLEGFAPDHLLADERLDNLRQLMSAGCYGALVASADAGFDEDVVCERLAHAGRRAVLAPRERQALAVQAGHARLLLAEDGWDYLRVTLAAAPEGAGPDAAAEEAVLALDAEIGETLALLEGDTAVLLVAGTPDRGDEAPGSGAFVLAAPGYPPLGELRGVAWPDLAPTVLDLTGCEAPAGLPGQPLLAGYQPDAEGEDLSVDEEALLRARLAGLGYIG
jgi:hypothetical protein